MRKRVIFVAAEAGAAAWMAPVWESLEHPVALGLSDVARDHLQRRHALPGQYVAFPGQDVDLSDVAAVVVSATGRDGEARIVQRAASQNIPSLQVVDYWSNYSRRFVGALPDHIAVIDHCAVAEACAEGLEPGRLATVGHPGWEAAAMLAAAPRPSVAFIGQPLRRIFGDSLGYDEHSAWQRLVAVQAMRPDLIGELVYLLHPEEAEGPAGAVTTRDSGALLSRCGTIVGAFSSLMIDALLGGRHVISLQPDAVGDDRCALSRHGRIVRATDSESLLRALSMAASGRGDLGDIVVGSVARVRALIDTMVRA